MAPTVTTVLNALFQRPHQGVGHEPPRWTQVLGDGVLHVSYGDDGPVFLVTVEEVERRRWVPEQPIALGSVAGLDAELVGVVVDNFVHVQLRVVGSVPDHPAEDPALRLSRVQVSIDDGLGTSYEFSAGQFGGTGTERAGQQSFRPRPPTDVDQLVLTLRTPDGTPVRVPVRP